MYKQKYKDRMIKLYKCLYYELNIYASHCIYFCIMLTFV